MCLPLSMYLIWCLGEDFCEFNNFLSITYVDVFDFSVSICVVFLKVGFVSLIHILCCCVYWFLWVKCDFDGWIFPWLINFSSVTDVAAVYFITFSQKMFKLFWLHFFTLNHNYLTVLSLIFVLATVIYLVWYIFIYFISCFLNIYLFFELLLLIMVTSYCILYFIYPYILVHITSNKFYILSHILHCIVIIFFNR